MYAGSKYPTSDTLKIRPGQNIAHAQTLKAGMMDAESEGKKAGVDEEGNFRRVYPFTMSPETAVKTALEWIRGQEEEFAKQMVREQYPFAESITDLELSASPQRDFLAHPLFVPTHIFTLRTPIFHLKMRTFVGAFPGSPVSGKRHFHKRHFT